MTVIEPGTRHECNLPDPEHLKDDTLAQCRTRGCDRWWFRYVDYTYWVNPDWAPVRWFHFNLRRRIKQEQEDD